MKLSFRCEWGEPLKRWEILQGLTAAPIATGEVLDIEDSNLRCWPVTRVSSNPQCKARPVKPMPLRVGYQMPFLRAVNPCRRNRRAGMSG